MSANILPFSDSELAALKTTVNEVRSTADMTDGWSVNVWIRKITEMTQVSEFSSRVLQEGNKEAFTSILFEAEETKGRTAMLSEDELRVELGEKFNLSSIDDLRTSIRSSIFKCAQIETSIYPHYGRNSFFLSFSFV